MLSEVEKDFRILLDVQYINSCVLDNVLCKTFNADSQVSEDVLVFEQFSG